MVGDTSKKKTKEGDRMIRGTTPTLTFTIPLSSELIQSLYITFVQNGREVLTLTEKDCHFDGTTGTVKLTQAQTLRFNHSQYAEVQARILTKDGTALASNICCCTINRILKDGEIG